MKLQKFFFLSLLLLLLSCHSPKSISDSTPGDGKVAVIILQLNDTYEIAGLERGTVGGMSRVATLRKQLLEENPNTFFVHAGDFLNPSLIGIMEYEGAPIKGRQMVEVMNKSGVDLITFGNHEFDLKEKDLQKRLNESDFKWLGTNVRHNTSEGIRPFRKMLDKKTEDCPDTYIWNVKDTDGDLLRIGFFGATINSNPKKYVRYEDHTKKAVAAIKKLNAKSDLIIGLTHLEIDQDTVLARVLQNQFAGIGEVPLFMGGHDHDNMIYQIGRTQITKADANARTAYVHRITFDLRSGRVDHTSKLVKIDQWLQKDPKVKMVVEKWTNIADESFRKAGFDPNKVVATLDEPLDGRESSIRYGPTNLGQMVCRAMGKTARQPVAATLLNSGSFRVDDQLSGEITETDIIRTLPYGGSVVEVDLKGSLLKAVLNQGWKNKGRGGFLQWDKVVRTKRGSWEVDGQPIGEQKDYHIALNNFLLLGLDIKILTEANPGIIKISRPDPNDKSDLRNDIRKAVIRYLQGS